MLMEKATDIRKNWGFACDCVAHDKPMLIKRTRDKLWFSSLDTMSEILDGYHFTAEEFEEDDGSITLSLNEIDLVENAETEKEAVDLLAKSILEYANEYYENYEQYSHSPNRKSHIPYIFKALIMDDPAEIGESIVCQAGKN